MSEGCTTAGVTAADRAFPVGGGGLGELIRNFDRSKTSLGPISTWPQSLRTATNIVLQSPLPLVMLWGPDGVMIYNDAYSAFAGRRHPRLLGSKVLEGWAEVADFNARVLEVGLAGGTLSFKDQELTLYRNNVPEQVWMDLSYGPVLGDDNRPAGVLAIVVETTERVRAERRQAFLFKFGDRLRDLAETGEIMAATVEMLGRHLGASRVWWAEIDERNGRFTVQKEWTDGDMPDLAPRRPGDFGVPLMNELRAGRMVCFADALGHPSAAGEQGAAAFCGADIRSAAIVPLVRAGRCLAALYVHSRGPRHWREDERVLMREVADRTWAAVQRAQAEARVRESEARFRALVNATSDVVYRMSPDWTEMRQLDGRGFIADTESPSIAWADEYLFTEDQPHIMAAIREAIRTRGVFQLEHRVRRVDGTAGWTFSRAIPLLDEDGDIVEWFGAASDVTARREAEEHLRLVVNELNHRVKNNLAMIQAIAA